MMYGTVMGFGWVWLLILMIGLAALVWGVMRARSTSSGGGRSSATGGAREILQERYARGEISEQEMRERMRALDDQ